MKEAVEGGSKACSRCSVVKAASCFDKKAGRPLGRRAECKRCRQSEYAENHGAVRAAQAAWYANNPDVRARAIKRTAEWRKENREHYRRQSAEYMRARRRASPALRVHSNIGSRVGEALHGRKAAAPTFSLLGYSLDHLMAHLERQFLRGMSWDNYGKWHIDHIVPLSSFTITGPDDPELRRAWALPNLRPLWAKENLSKGARRLTLL